MNNISLILLILLQCSITSKIELPLYKMDSTVNKLYTNGVKIEDIVKSNFLTNLELGTPTQNIPLDIEMSSEDISIINNNKYCKIKNLFLSAETSNTFQIIEDQKADDQKAVDKFILNDNNLDLQFKSINKIKPQLNSNQTDSNGILGFSLGDVKAPKDNKFLPQLIKNKVIKRSVFYYEFKEPEVLKYGIITFRDYLGITGKMVIGDYPYIISPEKYNKNRIKTSPVIQTLDYNDYIYDDSSNAILMDTSNCIGCAQCVKACSTISGQNILECEEGETTHTASGQLLADTPCIGCGQCSLVCPMLAITEKYSKDEVTNVLKNKQGKTVVCQLAPGVRINMAESFGIPAGTISTGKIVTALKLLGFDYIFDTTFGADMTIVEEATEFINRLNDPEAVLPMFTSCCPAWINYIEKSRPDLIDHLSSCRSPMSMLSSVTKNIFAEKQGIDKDDIYNVAIMPCTSKKDEIKRPQLNNETDAVITARELATMIRDARIDFKNLNDSEMDTIYSEYTGGGALFCATGGVMESAVRSAYRFMTGKDMVPIELVDLRGYENAIKTASIDFNGRTINVAVAHGMKNGMDLLDKIEHKEKGFENIHFVEVMACPGGCVVGGGAPKPKNTASIDKRLDATYEIDEETKNRVAQDNEQLNRLYNESFDGIYGSHRAHELLHTYYSERKIEKTWGINFKQISLNHTSTSSFSTQGIIKVENNFIKAPNNFFPVLQREYLNLAEIRNKCSIHYSSYYKFILCKGAFDVNSFPKLEFYSDELDHTFVFEGKDLFVYNEVYKYYMFLIIFDQLDFSQTVWELGLPFLRKEKIYFDMDKESLSIFYDMNTVNQQNTLSLAVIVMIISFIIGLIVSYLFMIPKKQRKNRLTELKEDYEYNEAQ